MYCSCMPMHKKRRRKIRHISTGIFNLMPIPLLDGGHIIYFTLRSIFADRLPHIVTRIYLAIGITIISFLFIFITLNDIFYK